jgi:hypothetical protein
VARGAEDEALNVELASFAIALVMVFTAVTFLALAAFSSWKEPERPRTFAESCREALNGALAMTAIAVFGNWLLASFAFEQWEWSRFGIVPAVALIILAGDTLHRRYRAARPGT